MPAIREGERDYSRSNPISIPSGKSKSRHDDYGKSSYSGRDSSHESMQSPMSRVTSNTSSVRRGSVSSYRNSPPEYIDDEEGGLDGSLGWRRKVAGNNTHDPYSASLPSGGRSSGGQQYVDPRVEHSQRDRLPQEESRHRKKDIDGSYGWREQAGRPILPDPEPVRMRSQKKDRYEEHRYAEIPSRGSNRHYA